MPEPRIEGLFIVTGTTGRFQFRRQSITGLPVLQVEVRGYHTTTALRKNEADKNQTSTYWRDASMVEAISLQHSLNGRN